MATQPPRPPFLRRLSDPRRVARRLRAEWERRRPFPLPHYAPGTPRAGGEDPLLSFMPTAATLGAAAMSEEAADAVLEICRKLTPSEVLALQELRLRLGRDRFGRYWRDATIVTTLWAAATLIRPRSYLEIGVQRGRSAAVVGAVCPGCAIYGFDLWVPAYAGVENPGPDFVRGELRAVGHQGEVQLISGDSRETLPRFLREHPDLYFDLVTIDGGKTIPIVASDFAHALPRLKVGGVLVYDDLPIFPILRRVWNKVIERDGRYVTWEYHNAGFGVATAIRVSAEAPLPLLPGL